MSDVLYSYPDKREAYDFTAALIHAHGASLYGAPETELTELIDRAAEYAVDNGAYLFVSDGDVKYDSPYTSWVTGDSETLLDVMPFYDFILTCPPYSNIERYTDEPGDLSNMKFKQFTAKYESLMVKAVSRLRPDSFACMVVGNFRGSDGCLIDLSRITSEIMERAGLKLYNDGILATMVGTAALRTSANFGVNHKLGRVHQYVNVYVKGDPKRAMAKIHKTPYGAWQTAVMPPDTDWSEIVRSL